MVIASILTFFYFIFKGKMSGEPKERTFIMIKPDGVQRGLIGEIISRFEKKGFKLVSMKLMWVSNLLSIITILLQTINFIIIFNLGK